MNTSPSTVFLFHGILRTGRHMRKLAGYLQEQGYRVINHTYPSTHYSLEELTELTWREIAGKMPADSPSHFVGYSMGGLLVRAMLSKYRPPSLGRVVLLAVPNKGSEIADFLRRNYIYKKLFGPAGQQLVTDSRVVRHLFQPIDYECGVIAGNASIDPISSHIIGGINDGKVSVESTEVYGMTDHIIVKASHTFFPHNKAVQSQTVAFLRDGHFSRVS